MMRLGCENWWPLALLVLSGCSASASHATDGETGSARGASAGAAGPSISVPSTGIPVEVTNASGGTPSSDSGATGSGGSASSSAGEQQVQTADPPPKSDGPPGKTDDPPPGDTGDPPPGDTGDPPPGDTGDPPPGDTGDPPPGDTGDPPCIPSELNDVNVIVFDDATPSGADVEGRMYVGGDATLEGFGVGNADKTLSCDEFVLVVGGTLSMRGGAVGNGKISYGVGLDLNNVATPCGVTQGSATDPVDFAALEASLIAYSRRFRDYAANGEARAEFGTLTLSGTNPGLNVFDITAEDLNQDLHFSAPAGSSIIVNVSGTDVVWQGRGFRLPDGGASCRGGSSEWCSRILYNLHEAETLSLAGIGVQGSVLAPYATLDGAGGNIDGQLVVRNLVGGIEYHPYLFNGCLKLPSAPGVPAP
jgi:choice-of-anchor A domain-containing protein